MRFKWILILALAILSAIAISYLPQWQNKLFVKQPLPTPSQSPGNPQVCIQVITSAKDPQTGECRSFPTPCDVPEGWEKVQACFYSN